MNKEEALKKINEQDSGDYEVFTETEHKTYLDNFKKNSVQPLVDTEVSGFYKRNDDILFDILGERKEGNEKTNDFMKRKLESFKADASKTEAQLVEIDRLKKALEDNSGDEQLKRDLDTVRSEYKKSQDDWKAKETELGNQMSDYQLHNELDKSMVGMKFKDDVPDGAKSAFINQVKNELLKSARIVEGKMIFIGDDGQTLVNKDNALNPFTPTEMLSTRLESIMAKSDKIDGLKKPKVDVINGKEVVTLVNPNAKSRQEVSEYLAKSGIPNSSPEHSKYYELWTKDLPKV